MQKRTERQAEMAETATYCIFKDFYFILPTLTCTTLVAVSWLKYCQYDVKHYPINQSLARLKDSIMVTSCIQRIKKTESWNETSDVYNHEKGDRLIINTKANSKLCDIDT